MKLTHEALTCYCMFLLMLPGETGIMTELYVSLALLMYLLMVAKYTTQLIFNMSMANL